MNISSFLSISRPCDDVLQWAKGQLVKAGLRPVQTFDLHAARVGLHDCPCPNHGMNECDCQMVVLLVYGKVKDVSTPLDANPVTLILHGNDGQTWLSIADSPRQKSDARLMDVIHQALEIEAPGLNMP